MRCGEPGVSVAVAMHTPTGRIAELGSLDSERGQHT